MCQCVCVCVCKKERREGREGKEWGGDQGETCRAQHVSVFSTPKMDLESLHSAARGKRIIDHKT